MAQAHLTRDADTARDLILRYGWNTLSYQILNPGITLWFNESRSAVIGYVASPSHLIAAGVPVTGEDDLLPVTEEFLEFAASLGKRVCFFGAQERFASVISTFYPASLILLGAQPVWQPRNLAAQFGLKPSLRAQVARAKNAKVTAEVCTGDRTLLVADLKRCLDEWLQGRGLPALHFLVEPDTLGNLNDRILTVARKGESIVGYCIATPIPGRNGWLIEQIIRGNGAPNGTVELLLKTATASITAKGGSFITLGLSPLSGHYAPPFRQPLWLSLILKTIRQSGKSFYNFAGLDTFKAKFQPDAWEPVYAITNEARPSPGTLYAIATAFCGDSPFRFLLKSINRILS